MDSFLRRHDCAAVVKGLVGGVAVVTRPVRPDSPTLRRGVSESGPPFSTNAPVSRRPRRRFTEAAAREWSRA